MADRACIALYDEGRILMVRQRYRGTIHWTFPGGGIEPGETPRDAAIREVAEETGLVVILHELLAQCPRTNGQGTYYCYRGTISQGEVQLGSDPELGECTQELLEVRWQPLTTMRTHPEVALIWEQLQDAHSAAHQ
ncbi:MAG: NUDIX hydrolase [Caldilineaceae bacterium]|nr:NUDIX hydrolase [Caldilineaceae bacterium]